MIIHEVNMNLHMSMIVINDHLSQSPAIHPDKSYKNIFIM